MGKKVAVLQSNYIPWKGYFDIINLVDEFVLYDDVQYTKNDWRNRNRIKTRQGVQWITIPVLHEHLSQTIRDTKVADRSWGKKHWKTLGVNYSRAAYFKEYESVLGELYLKTETVYLSEINYSFIRTINSILGIKTKLSWSNDYVSAGNPTERLVMLCAACGASEYVSGPAAREYLDMSLFERAKIKLTWMDYSGYPEYLQLYPPFEHSVSILDLLFNVGPDATKYMKRFGARV